MLQKLIERGYTQGGIADALKAAGVPCAQSTISRVLNGTDPSYTVGSGIRKLYVDVFHSSEVA